MKFYQIFPMLIVFGLTVFSNDSQASSNEEPHKENLIHFGNMGGLLPTLQPEDFAEPNSQGALLTQKYCSQCHNAPGAGFKTPKEWEKTFWRMNWRMHLATGHFENVEAPKFGESDVMFKYLTRNAMNSIPHGNIPDTLEGARDFKQICYQCHELPNPEHHTKEEWATTIQRMTRHMVSMEKVNPEPEKKARILKLLQSLAKD